MDIYKKINPINRVGGDALDELKIRVCYDKGGYYGKRGVYAYIRPVHRDIVGNGLMTESCSVCGEMHENGFKMLLRELSRKSQKVEDEFASKIEAKADEIASLWNEYKHNDVADILRNAM